VIENLSEVQLARLARGRSIRVALPSILSLLEDQLQTSIEKLCGAFNAGETNFLKHAAEITTLKNLQEHLLSEEKQATHIEEQINATRT